MSPLARSILITGASRGIGLEMVRQLAKSSPPPEVLIATCRTPSSALDLQKIAKENEFVKIIKLDVEDDGDIDAAVKETEGLVGDLGLNLLINNAGIYLNKQDHGRIRVQTRERLQRTFNVNSTSPIIVTQKFLPLLELASSHQKDNPLGCKKAASMIVSGMKGSQTTTYASTNTNDNSPLDYKMSKSAVNMAAILMAKDLKESGILVTALHPGWVETDMGGPDAPLSMKESVEGLIQIMSHAGEELAGLVVDYKGELLPF